MPIKTVSVAVLALALLASGVAAAATHQSKRTHKRHAHARPAVVLRKTKLGKVLAANNGRTLYLYTPDPKGKSVCAGSCAQIWPPLLTKHKPRAGRGVKKSLLGTTRRSNGKLQVTYAGHPLYRFDSDRRKGQTKGEGYGGIWYAVSASGKKVMPKQSGGTTTGGGGSGGGGGYGGGYGY